MLLKTALFGVSQKKVVFVPRLIAIIRDNYVTGFDDPVMCHLG